MKIKRWLFGIFVGVVVAMTGVAANVQAVGMTRAWAANVQDFAIESFTADYYLTKSEKGTGNLHVKETIVANFPATNQNHGLTRTIPRTNQDGANVTVASQDALNLKVTRNGQSEPISQIEENDDVYTVYIGDEDKYVQGEQTYVLEYDFTNVITEFDANGQNISGKNGAVAWQELYWDTNGNGWQQPIGQLTANLHLPSDVLQSVEKDRTSCYVGVYGAGGAAASSRCKTTATSDGYTFSTTNLTPGENLTYAVDFDPGTFVVKVNKNYTLVIVIVVEAIIGVVALALLGWLWAKKAGPNHKLYKSLFVTTQYLPPKDVSIAEAQRLYRKRMKAGYVATLLEMSVQRKIAMKSTDGKKWSVVLNVSPDTLTNPEKDVLNIIAGRDTLAQGVEIPIRRQYSNYAAQKYAKDYQTDPLQTLAEKGYLTQKSLKTQKWIGLVGVLAVFVLIIVGCLFFSSGAIDALDTPRMLGGTPLLIAIIVLFVALVIACVWFANRIAEDAKYTEQGVKMVRYLEGLEQYVRLAEKDRLAFMQSVKGADTSAEGLVHLYEKLLPWACLFGVEKSWAKELDRYYQMLDERGYSYYRTYDPYLMHGIIAGNMVSRMNNAVAGSVSSGSSSSSGGGGGGFSGGGGGGGGGGGW